jgi:hypothetical protein
LVFSGEPVVWAHAFRMWQVLKEFLVFLRQEKKWWLLPLVVLLLAIGAVIVFTSSSILAPFLYPFL